MKEKKIIIRADGNARIGAGHLMRCLTIADAVPEKESVVFVCADEESAALTRERGYEARVLHTDYREMETELPVWQQMLGISDMLLQQSRVILVDSYYMTNAYLTELKKYGFVVVLDDMAKTPWNADVVINYNAFADQEMYEALDSPYETRYYTGGRYIPIRAEFCNVDGRKNSGNAAWNDASRAGNILITTGGGDLDNIAGQILKRIWLKNCHYNIVTGRFNPHYDTLLKLAEEYSNIHIYHDVKNMAQLMEQCDLAVTAGGTTIYELSAMGVPFVCFSYAENQEKLTEYIGKHGIAGYGGAFHKEPEQTLNVIREQILELQENVELRRKYSEEEQKLVDGRGAARIAEILCKK